MVCVALPHRIPVLYSCTVRAILGPGGAPLRSSKPYKRARARVDWPRRRKLYAHGPLIQTGIGACVPVTPRGGVLDRKIRARRATL